MVSQLTTHHIVYDNGMWVCERPEDLDSKLVQMSQVPITCVVCQEYFNIWFRKSRMWASLDVANLNLNQRSESNEDLLDFWRGVVWASAICSIFWFLVVLIVVTVMS